MANRKTKVFKLNGESVTATKISEITVKVGVMRAIKADEFEGGCQLFKLITGKDDEFLDEITNVELAEVLEWAGAL